MANMMAVPQVGPNASGAAKVGLMDWGVGAAWKSPKIASDPSRRNFAAAMAVWMRMPAGPASECSAETTRIAEAAARPACGAVWGTAFAR